VSCRGDIGVGTTYGVEEGLGAESAGVFLSLFEWGLGDKAGTGDEAGSRVGDGARGGVGDGVSGADAGAYTGGRSWIGVGERMLTRRSASKEYMTSGGCCRYMKTEYPGQKQQRRGCQGHLCGSSCLCHRMADVLTSLCGGVDSPSPWVFEHFAGNLHKELIVISPQDVLDRVVDD